MTDFFLHLSATVIIFIGIYLILKDWKWSWLITITLQIGKEIFDIYIQNEKIDWADIEGNFIGLVFCFLIWHYSK
mgnify:CR=1 FL=1